jgi:hypothetical protein
MNSSKLWERYKTLTYFNDALEFSLDLSRMDFADRLLAVNGAEVSVGFSRDGCARGRGDCQPGRESHGRALLAAQS